MTASGVFSSWDTLAMKSVRSVSMPASSCAILLRHSAIVPKPSALSMVCIGGMRTEKSPFMICSAADVIFRTGRSTMIFRRMPSITVHKRLSKSTLRKVTLAACSMCTCVSVSPVVRDIMFKNRVMQQLMTNAISRKKSRYRRRASSQRTPLVFFSPLISAPPYSRARAPSRSQNRRSPKTCRAAS